MDNKIKSNNFKLNGRKIEICMANARLNAFELCEAAGIQYQTYRRIIQGNPCKPATAGSIAVALGVRVEILLESNTMKKMSSEKEYEKTMPSTNNMKFIIQTMEEDELLCQMAEEAAELAQAAMKYRRKMVKGNPTTVSWKKARENLLEEIADVMFLAELLLWDEPKAWEQVENTKEFKAKRWVGRLKGEENLEQE